jgi:hypothetical protein
MGQKNFLLVCGLIVLMTSSFLHGFGKKTFFSTRSQSVNTVRDIVGWQQEINRYQGNYECFVRGNRPNEQYEVCTPEMFTVFSITPEYSRSFAPSKMADILFGSECVVFSGSRYPGRAKTDVLSDYWGLPSDFKSVVNFNPVITNFLMDFGWFHGLDAWVPGLYYRVHMPIVHAKWDLHMHENVKSAGTPFNTSESADPTYQPATYPAGYLGPNRILLNDSIPQNMVQAFEGKKMFGDVGNPLQYGKIFGRQLLTRASELQLAIGWNYFEHSWWHAGAQVRCAMPAGNRSQAEFLFEPMVGNGGHWELGIGLSGHVQLWQNCNGQHTVALYSDFNVTHLFNATEKRSFDFTQNGPGSRYMLIADIEAPALDLFLDNAGTVLAQNQYQRRLMPAINKTTLDVNIGIAAQIDWVIKAAWQWKNMELDLGYNFWYLSKEKIDGCIPFQSNRFGLKGDAQLYGFNGTNATPLNATQHDATVQAGQGAGNGNYENTNADNSQPAYGTGGAILNNLTVQDVLALGIASNPVNLSNPAILLKDTDLNLCSGLMPHAISHKIFMHVNYAWHGRADFTPYLGGGGAVEFASNCFATNSAHSQWFLWIKGGLSY